MFRMMLILLLIALPVRAGDAFEAYFYIVGAIPSELKVETDTDTASAAFRDRLNTLSAEWTEKCGVHVNVWHTNMVSDDETPWTPNLWFAYLSDGDTAAQARANLPNTACAEGGYVKRGFMVIPTMFQMCAAPAEFGMPEDQDICK